MNDQKNVERTLESNINPEVPEVRKSPDIYLKELEANISNALVENEYFEKSRGDSYRIC